MAKKPIDPFDIPPFLQRKAQKLRKILQKVSEGPKQPIVSPKPKPIEVLAPVKEPGPSVQDRIDKRAAELVGEIEGLYDDNVATADWSLYDHFSQRAMGFEVSQVVAKRFAEKLQPRFDELIEVLSDPDDQLKEAYAKYKPKEIEERAVLYQLWIDDALRYADVNKKIRAPRKKKKPSVERVVRGVKYALKDDHYKVASIDPAKVIGAQELWTFSPKNKLVTVYRAIDRAGLTFKGSSVVNIDDKRSFAKKIGRNAETKVQTLLDAGKVSLRKFMDELSSEAQEPTRITKHTLLIRVVN